MAGRLTPYPHHDNMNMPPLSYGGGFKPERGLHSHSSRRMSRRSISSGFPSSAAHLNPAVQRQYSTNSALPGPGGMVRNASLVNGIGMAGLPGGEHQPHRASRTPQNSPFLGRAEPQLGGQPVSPTSPRMPDISPGLPPVSPRLQPVSPHLPPLPPVSPRPVSPGHPQGSYGRRSPGYGHGYQDPYSPASSYAQARSPSSPYSYTAYGHRTGHRHGHGHGHQHRHHRSRSRPLSSANVNYTVGTSVPHQSRYGSHYTRTQHLPYAHTSHVGVVRRHHHHGSGSREPAFVVEPSDSGSDTSSYYSGGYDSDSFYSGSDGDSFYSDDEYEYDSGDYSDDDGYYSDD